MTTATAVDLELSRLLSSGAVDRRSGIVSAVRGKHKRLFCLEHGVLVFAASNVVEEQFTEALLRQDLITVADLSSARVASEKTGVKLNRLLVDEKVVEGPALEHALEEHVRRLLYSTLDWPDGEASLERGNPDLDGELKTKLPCIPLILEYTDKHPASLDELQERVSRMAEGLQVSEAATSILSHGEAPRAMTHLLGKIDGPTPIAQLLESSSEPEEPTWRWLYGLLLLGALEPTAKAERETKRQTKLTREEILSRLEHADLSDHYRLLRVSPFGSRDDVRKAYYDVARDYHPDRFRTGPLQEFRERMESYFSRITEAYNTLYDPDLRAEYDSEQAEEKTETTLDTTSIARENFKRAQSLIARGRFSEAVSWLENAIQQDPTKAIYRLELGQVLSRNPRLRPKAIQHLVEANRLDPSLIPGYLTLGELYLKQGDTKRAARMFREALRWEPGNLVATEKLADLG